MERSNSELFRATNFSYDPQLMHEREMLSCAHVNAVVTQPMNKTFLDKIRVAGKEDVKSPAKGWE